MEEMQFNASLDALWDGENLSDGSPTGSNAYGQVPGSITMHNQSIGQCNQQPSQGLLMTSGTISTTSLPTMRQDPMIMPTTSVNYGEQMPTPDRPYAPLSQYSGYSCQQPLIPSTVAADSVKSCDEVTVVSSTASGKSRSVNSKPRKRARDLAAVSEDEGERHKRRHDRNMREQQRSQKITSQIDHLRDVLSQANVQFKPDKYSTLVSVADYIKQLQEKSAMLDVEQKKLLDTITRTNELANEQYLPASTSGSRPPGSEKLNEKGENEGDCFVPSIDYRNIFSRCGVPLAVLSIDGRFLDCNKGFENLTGFSREELLPCENPAPKADEMTSLSTAAPEGATVERNLSLFNLLNRENMEGVFVAMSEMLKNLPSKELVEESEKHSRDHWAGEISLSRNKEQKLLMNVSLVRSAQGRAKFFDCSLTAVPVDEEKG